jgi:bifunctional non-homologous end joining protein LigD
MLAVQGQAFDSDSFFFEYKWDGFRTGAYIEDGRHRLMSRGGLDVTASYPGLGRLSSLPGGLVLDGELVAFVDGLPDFEAMQAGAGGPAPVCFVAFDILYLDHEPVMALPFSQRRSLLEDLVGPAQGGCLALSAGLASGGRSLYAKACELGLEGVMAKRTSSAYAAGKRNGSWVKIKRRFEVQLAIIGYIDKGRDFQCLLVAGNEIPGTKGSAGGRLRYVGRVGGGFSEGMRERLNALLRARPRSEPLVPCPEKGTWVEPGLYCAVSFAELTSQGLLRAPVFEALVEA